MFSRTLVGGLSLKTSRSPSPIKTWDEIQKLFTSFRPGPDQINRFLTKRVWAFQQKSSMVDFAPMESRPGCCLLVARCQNISGNQPIETTLPMGQVVAREEEHFFIAKKSKLQKAIGELVGQKKTP